MRRFTPLKVASPCSASSGSTPAATLPARAAHQRLREADAPEPIARERWRLGVRYDRQDAGSGLVELEMTLSGGFQPGMIYGDQKWSFRVLRRLHRAGKLSGPAAALWAKRKPLEELYDLRKDPHEIKNLAASADLAGVKKRLQEELRTWILEHGDTGMLREAEYQIRGLGTSPYELVRDSSRCDLPRVLAAAERVGDESVPIGDLGRGGTRRRLSLLVRC